ncbi:hypothetical protein CDV36_008960 [Fusarium kuroshium]|uniref:Uncharacterized protein n=2 Tax=Fusarium solani species complex TaxID=232080 RepID=A0A3M2S1I2_9HYPO|nr:hypothetical protein CDV36_008960 [Fusarium kuroshium]RSM02823.1 hypothetical protein CEP52_007689 [Fusarium oligoseptatum]
MPTLRPLTLGIGPDAGVTYMRVALPNANVLQYSGLVCERKRYVAAVAVVGVIPSNMPITKVKIGLNPSVLTLNMIPIRMKYGPDWNGTFSNWPIIEQAYVNFASDILKESRIIIAMGEAQFSDTCSITQSQGFLL